MPDDFERMWADLAPVQSHPWLDGLRLSELHSGLHLAPVLCFGAAALWAAWAGWRKGRPMLRVGLATVAATALMVGSTALSAQVEPQPRAAASRTAQASR